MCMHGGGVTLEVTQPLVLIFMGSACIHVVHDVRNNVLTSCLKGIFSLYRIIQYEACCSCAYLWGFV